MTRLVFSVVVTLVIPTCAAAQLPATKFASIFPPGGGRGATFSVRIAGVQDLDYATVPRLVFSHPGIVAEAVADPVNGQWHDTFRISIADDVPIGNYDVRLNGIYGTSAPRAFRVDASPSESEAADIGLDAPATLQTNVPSYGRIGGDADVDSFVFQAEQGTTVVVLCDATALDSPLQPIVEVTDPSGHQIANAGSAYGGTVILPVEIATTGSHTVRLTDAAYRGHDTFHYRIEIATRPVVTTIWPPFGQPGTSQPVELLGYNLSEGVPVTEGKPLLRRSISVELPADARTLPESTYITSHQADVDGFRLPLGQFGIDGGPHPIFYSSTRPTIAADDDDEPPPLVGMPVDIAGRFEKALDVDRYQIDLKAGDTIIAEIFARRYGSTADAVLTVERIDPTSGDAQERITTVDDHAVQRPSGVFNASTDDPLLRFEVKEDGRYQISVRDRYATSRGDHSLFYRLSLRQPTPDFRLYVAPQTRNEEKKLIGPGSINLRRRQRVLLPVVLDRLDGFDGRVHVDVEGLPPGVTTDGGLIAESMTSVNVVLTADAEAAADWSAVTVVGREILPDSDKPIRRTARIGTVVRGGANFTTESRISHDFIVSVVDDAVPYRIDGLGGQLQVAQGSQVLVPLSATRQNGFDAEISVTFDPLPADSQVSVQTGSLATDDEHLLVQMIVGSAAPPQTLAPQFYGGATIDTTQFPHRLVRATERQKIAARTAEDVRSTVAALIARRNEVKTSLASGEETLQTADEAERAAASTAVDELRVALAEREAELTTVQSSLQKCESELKAADAELEAARKAAEPRSVPFSSPAPGMTLSIVPASVTVTVTSENDGIVKRNESISMKVIAERRDGFAGEIQLSLALPDGVKGLTAEPVSIGPGKNEAHLQISAASDAVEGPVPFPAIRAIAIKDGEIPIYVPVTLTVAP